jgi:hypothetical protein
VVRGTSCANWFARFNERYYATFQNISQPPMIPVVSVSLYAMNYKVFGATGLGIIALVLAANHRRQVYR